MVVCSQIAPGGEAIVLLRRHLSAVRRARNMT
jgi:hypothetical protein